LTKHQTWDGVGLPLTCGLILCCILVAGLWPFQRPANQVSWPGEGNGLVFGHHSVVVSSSPMQVALPSPNEACTIEIWLQLTSIRNYRTILTFYTPENPREFSLSMWDGGLLLRKEVPHQGRENEVREAFVADVFHLGQPVFISITSDGRKSLAYLNGTAVTPNRPFAFSSTDLAGQLVIGPSPTSSDGFSGKLLGLAIYRGSPTAAEALHDYVVWTQAQDPQLIDNASSVRLVSGYRFDEGHGATVHNLVKGGPQLDILANFVLLAQPMLQRPWAEFRWTWGYWRDAMINVAGFTPLGFFFYAYLSKRNNWAPTATTVLIGVATSFTIEFLQAYLPTRDSGLTDIFTNTLGTYIGVLLYRAATRRNASPQSVTTPLPLGQIAIWPAAKQRNSH
jgi:hypothetical protein